MVHTSLINCNPRTWKIPHFIAFWTLLRVSSFSLHRTKKFFGGSNSQIKCLIIVKWYTNVDYVWRRRTSAALFWIWYTFLCSQLGPKHEIMISSEIWKGASNTTSALPRILCRFTLVIYFILFFFVWGAHSFLCSGEVRKGEGAKDTHHIYDDKWLRTENKCVLCLFIDANWITWFECEIRQRVDLVDGLLMVLSFLWVFQWIY